MSCEYKEGKIIETKQICEEIDVNFLCKQRDSYKNDVEYFSKTLAEVEAKIKIAKDGGWEEPEEK